MSVLIVGSGVIGLSTACALARDGHDVQLVEREVPGCRASWVAAGLLTPNSPWNYPPRLMELGFASEALYPDFVADLREHTGIDPELDWDGMLYTAGVGVPVAELAEDVRRREALGFRHEAVARAELDRRFPGLGPEVCAGSFQPRAGRVRPPRLNAALRRRAEGLGVEITSRCEVTALCGDAHGVTGALTATGQRLEADVVVLAAGAWSGRLAATLGLTIEVHPVRGQIVLLAGPPGLLRPTLNDGEVYLVPRRDGRILVGSTMEEVGFNAWTTPETIAALLARARRLLPACAALPVEMDWAGLRPGTPDRLPYLGAVPSVPGLILATGHFRNGILLAPITAATVADLVAARTPALDLSAYAPRELDPQAVLAGH